MQHTNLELPILLVLICFLLLCFWRLRVKKLKEYHSDILGLIEIWKKYNGEKLLTINKYHHGISTDDKSITRSYWYFIAQQVLNHIKDKKQSEVLFFGLGANTSSRIINDQNPQAHQTIIEIDQSIIEACREFFHLDEMKNVTIIKDDAYKLIDQKPDFKHKFDVIIVDIFTGIPPYVSTKTNQPPFIEKLLKWSKIDGRVIFNRPANIQKDRKDTKKLSKYLKLKFKEVKIVYIKDRRGYQNDIITASIIL